MIYNAIACCRNPRSGPRSKSRMSIGLPMVKSEHDLQWKDFPQIVLMPCGGKYKFNSADEVPKQNVKCPCGHPDHYIVKYF